MDLKWSWLALCNCTWKMYERTVVLFFFFQVPLPRCPSISFSLYNILEEEDDGFKMHYWLQSETLKRNWDKLEKSRAVKYCGIGKRRRTRRSGIALDTENECNRTGNQNGLHRPRAFTKPNQPLCVAHWWSSSGSVEGVGNYFRNTMFCELWDWLLFLSLANLETMFCISLVL